MNPRTKALAALGCAAACAWNTLLLAATFTVATPADFQTALTTAASNAEDDFIQVDAGSYNLTATLTYPDLETNALTIRGADAATTILDGQNSVQVMSIEAGRDVQIRGLTFRNGNASAVGAKGGGLELRSRAGQVYVTECRFLNNQSQDDGGGLYARTSDNTNGDIELFSVLFEGNRTVGAGSDGGGAHLSAPTNRQVRVWQVAFTDNSAPDNGGGLQVEGLDPTDLGPTVAQVEVLDSLFVRNSTAQVQSGEGGGADLAANQIRLLWNQFYANSGAAGGGVFLRGFTSLRLEGSVLMGNRATVGDGGGIGTALISTAGVQMINNTVVANTAVPGNGAGAYLRVAGSTSILSIYNNIVWGNSAGAAQGADLYIDNNPFNDIGARVQLVANNATAVFVKCDTPACSVTRTDNLDVVPGLVNAFGPDFDPHLQSGSPMIDQGSADISLSEVDFEGDPRVSGSAVDIGADEYAGGGPPPPASADVAVTVTDSPDPVLTGGRLTYAITVTNAGPDGAVGVTLTDTLPSGVNYVSATPSQGSCSQAAGTVTCNLGSLAGTANATVTLAVDVTAGSGTTVTNSATISATTADPVTTNNSASATTQVTELRADLSVAVTVSPSEPSVDEAVTYTVTVRNLGPDNEPAASVDVTLPTLAELDSVTATQGSCKETSGSLFCTLGSLANGAQATVTVVVTASEAGTLTLQATVDGQLADATTANNSATGQTQVTDAVEFVVKGKGGSGSFSWLQLLGLAGLLLVRYGRRAQGAVSLAGLVLAVTLAVMPVDAPADDAGWYVGASAGASSADYGSSDLARDLDNRGWTILDPQADDSDTFWKTYVGYQVNSFIAVEVGYADLGEVETSYRAILPPSELSDLLEDTLAVHPYLGSGWTASGLLSGSFADDAVAVFARAGVFVWDADIEVKVASGGTGKRKGDESGTDAMFGVGFEWRINPAWVLRAEWERYKLNDWVDAPSAGIVWRFR